MELESLNESLKDQLVACQQELQFCQQDNTMLKVDASKLKKKMEKLKKQMQASKIRSSLLNEQESNKDVDQSFDVGDSEMEITQSQCGSGSFIQTKHVVTKSLPVQTDLSLEE